METLREDLRRPRDTQSLARSSSSMAPRMRWLA